MDGVHNPYQRQRFQQATSQPIQQHQPQHSTILTHSIQVQNDHRDSHSSQASQPQSHLYHNHPPSVEHRNGTPHSINRPIHPPPLPPHPSQPSNNINQRHVASGLNCQGTSQVLVGDNTLIAHSVRPTSNCYHNQPRSLTQHNYYMNAHYQLCQPTNLQVYPKNHNINGIHQRQNYDVRDSGEQVKYDGHQDHFTEQVIQAILAAKEALEKPIEERDERDIQLIDNLCSLVNGFDAFPKTVRRALAAQAVLIVIDEKGKELIVHNEELDSFCVLIFGECEQLNISKTIPVRYYHVGDAFGVCEPTTETRRFVGHLITKCENCAFLCVKRDDFYTILTDPANYPNKETVRHRDRNGNIICVSQFNIEKKSSGPLWSNHMQSTNPFKIVLPDGHVIVKATEAFLITALVDGYDRIDNDYVDDFLLLFRVFMGQDQRDREKKLPPGMIRLCLILIRWLDDEKYRDKVIKIVLVWLSSYYHDFELNPEYSHLFFKVLESRLLELSMRNQLHLLHATLSAKSKIRQVTITKSSREKPLPFSIGGGYEKNCGIFVIQVYGSTLDDCPYESFMTYVNPFKGPAVPPRHKLSNLWGQDSKNSMSLMPGDQILEINGANFSSIKLSEAQKKLDMSTHLCLTVKYNPSSFYEMRALPDGRRKSSMSSSSSISPFQPTSSNNRFNFNENIGTKLNDQYPPPSPLFSTNANFGFKSFVGKSIAKSDKSRLSSLISSSKQFVKQIRESTIQPSTNSIESISRTSDSISDDQSNDFDISKTKSNPDLNGPRPREKSLESGLFNMVKLNDLNPASMIDPSANEANQTLVNVLRVFNAANNESRYLLVNEETTSREVVMIGMREFGLCGQSTPQSTIDKSSTQNWFLYEVSVVPESRTIKQKCLSDQTSKLAERASLCSRFYIKNNSQDASSPSRLDSTDDTLANEILKESPSNITISCLNATLLAVELTLADFDKFRAIEPQQFVYDTFFNPTEESRSNTVQTNNLICSGSSSGDSASLKSSSSDGQDNDTLHLLNKTRFVPRSWMEDYRQFADISNKEMFWVVCEILHERNIGRRVKIVKQFIRAADVCSQLRNYNSMFAIISGLGHSCVNRLKRTFEKLKPKYRGQLEKMRTLFDPSRNMSNYRMCLAQTPPPAIPFFPLIKKDLTFTKEGRSIYVRELNDLSDDDEDNFGFGPTGSAEFSQDTIKRRSITDIASTKTHPQVESLMGPGNLISQPRSLSYSNFINNNNHRTNPAHDSENLLVNFAEIRQFTERVRNVHHFSSIPYSNDLLTNTKDSQRSQAQIKKMHEECQMRKRIRHYISQTLEKAPPPDCGKISNSRTDQIDSSSQNIARSSTLSRAADGGLEITYDERVLHQRSLEIEPELSSRIPSISSNNQLPAPTKTLSSSQVTPQSTPIPSGISSNSSQAQATPFGPNFNSMLPPALVSNPSPTLSKSSSLSSCSSFNTNNQATVLGSGFHGQHNVHMHRGTSSAAALALAGGQLAIGKFGTESTESLRKIVSLRENCDDNMSCQSAGSNNGLNRLGMDGACRAKSVVSAAASSMLVGPNSRILPTSKRM